VWSVSVAIHSAKAQVQAVPFVDTMLCQACPRCPARVVCKSKALLQLDPGEHAFVDASRCYGCNVCLPACPSGAVRLSPT
jgi:Fe-S-cluster-containing hydrogenase component 2